MLLEQVNAYISWMDEMLNINVKEFQRMLLLKSMNQICCKYYNLDLMTYGRESDLGLQKASLPQNFCT
jgi:hypothetical protein